MVEQWFPKPKVKGSNPFSPEIEECSLAEGQYLESTYSLGLSRFELLTLRLSSVRSNQLSYKPFE